MEFLEYLSEFDHNIRENYPNKDERTIENYVATFAAHPPALVEFYTPKCQIEAEAERTRGNQMFVAKCYEEAAIMYTNSIKKAPAYSKCAALGYANRSAALCHLKLWEDCISDIERALDLPYPDDLCAKITLRKEIALNNLKEDGKKPVTNDHENNNNEDNREDDNDAEKSVEDLKYGENPKLPGATGGIDIVHNPHEGRKLIATMPFHTGDTLIIQKPYIAVPVLDKDPVYCHHCLKKSFSLIPCEQCSVAVYCSEKCRRDAYDEYHRIECRIHYTMMCALPMNIGGLFCQLRCLNIFTNQGKCLNELHEEFKELEENTDPLKLGFTGDQFIGNTKKAVLSSLAGKEMKPSHRAFFEAGYIVTLLRNYTDFFKTNSDILIVANLLVKLNAAYIFNYFSIPLFGRSDVKAHATFPLVSLAKHACVNNTVAYIDEDGKMILRASQYIRPRDEISFAYHDLKFSVEKSSTRSGQMIQCKRICKKCDKTFVYPPERQPYIRVDKKLYSQMQRNPYDINGLWKILNLVRRKHQHYTLQAQIIKTMLVDAYEGRVDLAIGHMQLQMFGIL